MILSSQGTSKDTKAQLPLQRPKENGFRCGASRAGPSSGSAAMCRLQQREPGGGLEQRSGGMSLPFVKVTQATTLRLGRTTAKTITDSTEGREAGDRKVARLPQTKNGDGGETRPRDLYKSVTTNGTKEEGLKASQ